VRHAAWRFRRKRRQQVLIYDCLVAAAAAAALDEDDAVVTAASLGTRASARFWLGGSMPPLPPEAKFFFKYDYEMVHSEVYLNK